MILNILKLSRKTTKAELLELFETYGKVESCDIVMDKQRGLSKGFGFVTMPNDEEANEAIKNLHESVFGGKRIKVKAATKGE